MSKEKSGLGAPFGMLVVAGFGVYGSGGNVVATSVWAAVSLAAIIMLVKRISSKETTMRE